MLPSGPTGDTRILDIERGLISRFTSDPTNDGLPQWSPDGRTIASAFRSDRDGVANLYERGVGSVGEDKLLLKTDATKTPWDWSRDGRYLAYLSGDDVWALPLFGDRKPLRVTQTTFRETNARISPDGRWVAYQSSEPGGTRPDEVYVQSFPEPGAKKQVSTMGGNVPRWSRDGKELFYVTPDLTL